MYVLLEPALLLTLRKSIILCQDEREKPALLASIHEMRTLVQLKHAKVLVAQSCLIHFATPWTVLQDARVYVGRLQGAVDVVACGEEWT